MGGVMGGDGVKMYGTSLGGTLGATSLVGAAPGIPPETMSSVFSKEMIDPEKIWYTVVLFYWQTLTEIRAFNW